MTAAENERLAVVEQRQHDMADALKAMQADLRANTAATTAIKHTLDNLSGGKQALMWVAGFLVSVALVVAAYWGAHAKP